MSNYPFKFHLLEGELFYNYPLARHTSWRVGGQADCCYRPKDLSDLLNFLKQLPADEPLTWLGLGSNVLVRDGGVRGTVILTVNRLNALEKLANGEIRVEAGVTCAKLAKFCVSAGYESGTFFAGIPGTVGGALAMNAGAYGGETWSQVMRVDIATRDGRLETREPALFTPSYRHVALAPNEYFVAGYFRFPPGDSLRAKTSVSELLKKRNAAQPIGTYSCGSVFRNPVGDYAARLVESVGLKGFMLGEAQVSEKHANFILNTGQARAADIEALIELVKQRVYAQCGVMLMPEVRIIGMEKAIHSSCEKACE